MHKQTFILPAAALAMLAGCSTTPHYDQHYGDAVRQARQVMTINRGAQASSDPAAGIDGQAASQAVQRYQDSFKAPPPVVNVINVSGAAAAK